MTFGKQKQSTKSLTDEWLTPPHILAVLGQFDLDPCAAVNQSWPTARRQYTIEDDGLSQPWSGRVWCNPPYGAKAGAWLKRLGEHGNGVALIFARTETDMFFRYVWDKADALFFLRGRVRFCKPDGRPALNSAGAPSVLVAYGKQNVQTLRDVGKRLAGRFVQLK